MDKAKINGAELVALMLLFEMGSAVVVGLGMQAKQDAWLAILIGMSAGLILFLIYEYLFREHAYCSLVGYLLILFGKRIGTAAACLYLIYFFYIASRVLRDFGALLLSSILPLTPMSIALLMMVFPVVYACTLGIETIGRVGELLLTFIVMLGLLAAFLLVASGVIHWENLKPSLENGWKPVLATAFPLTMTFPFGETVVVSMLLPHLNNPLLAKRIGLISIALSGLILSFIIAVNISVLTAFGAENSTFPLLKTLGKIQFGGFIERLEAIAIITLIIGGFFKITTFLYACFAGLIELFQIERRKELAWTLGLQMFICSITIADNFVEHIEIGLKIVPSYLHLPFQVGLPLLLLALTWIRNKYRTTGR
ncbi:GerAB/ArcD/ProY family transporter [Paenibacillus sedimenti]|uniref:Endospore germination permease n=1 Tax=Paenibacillus sedimenti TaxID=2770274 RepID=A0A926QK74_9BACL|nr:endospore germination permease [Paenibacillus sedimenti]MBD0382300.1 endospore germination permease [Paenibacillus sedimenti]